MAYEWINANAALKFVSAGSTRTQAIEAICRRAHTGDLVGMAQQYFRGEFRQPQFLIPKEFWWAEGHAALDQDWVASDFSTWIDGKLQLRAQGVSFDFVALSELVPAINRATAMQAFSVISDPDWISAHDLMKLASTRFNPASAGNAIIAACQTGHLVAKALRVSISDSGRTSSFDGASVEWDIPLWFWRDFTGNDTSSQNWQSGIFKGRGPYAGHRPMFTLQGVYFHRAGLAVLGLANSEQDSPVPSNRGRKPEYDWDGTVTAIWGLVYRGDFKPDNQAQIEKAMQRLLTKGDKEPSESTVRPYASRIWNEMQKEA